MSSLSRAAGGVPAGAAQLLPEDLLQSAVELLVRLVEAAGAVIIFVGAVIAFARFLYVSVRHRRQPQRFVSVRLSLGRYLTLGLEFQLASDILRTAVAPTLLEIAQLAAIATIRTALNYFLGKEIKEEQQQLARDRDEPAPEATVIPP